MDKISTLHTDQFDVIVIGGGIAGISAAIRAARNGSRVALIEQYAFIGGSATAGMVSPFMKHDLNGVPLVSGIFLDLELAMRKRGGMIDNGFSALAFRSAAFDLLCEAGVTLLLQAHLTNVQRENGKIIGVTIRIGAAKKNITGSIFIDTSGDAQLLFLSDIPTIKGDEKSGLLQAMTLFFRMAEIDMSRVVDYVKTHREDFFSWMDFEFDFSRILSIAGFFSLVKQAVQKKQLSEDISYIFFTTLPASGEASFNTTNITGFDGSSSWDLTQAEINGRQQVHQVVRFLHKMVPGFENAILIETATQIGVRETRRAIGDYVMTGQDVLSARKFDDAIARGVYGIDIHGQKNESSRMEEIKSGDFYEIPLRALIVRDTANVLVAGRCISATREGHAALRIMPTSAATGEACGAWASLAVNLNKDLRKIDPDLVRQMVRHNIREGVP